MHTRGPLLDRGSDALAGRAFWLTIDTIAYDTPMATTGTTPHVRDDLARRIELVSMDRFCDDITLALYLIGDGTVATVHSYSDRPSAPARLAWLAEAMVTLGGMRPKGTDGRTVEFACGGWHELAARRAFLEACKVDPAMTLGPRPLETNDGRTGQYITVTSLGGGAYRVAAVAQDPNADNRAPAVAAGLAKLAALDADPEDPTLVRFSCGARHDELVGLLLPRAINVRAALRELEQAARRGVLVAPSAQEAGS